MHSLAAMLLKNTEHPEIMGLKSITQVDFYCFRQNVFNAKISENVNVFKTTHTASLLRFQLLKYASKLTKKNLTDSTLEPNGTHPYPL